MKTPDEIKKGLECCNTGKSPACEFCNYKSFELGPHGVHYVNYHCKQLQVDALAYIRRLERERDALVEDLSNCDGNCHFCDWFGDTGCAAPDDGKQPKHTHDCPFKWRGVQGEYGV